jgi:hypothetical protein
MTNPPIGLWLVSESLDFEGGEGCSKASRLALGVSTDRLERLQINIETPSPRHSCGKHAT